MSILSSKWTKAVLLLLPNFIIAFVQYGSNPVFAAGSAMGASTFVFVLYVIVQSLWRKKLPTIPADLLSIACAHALYRLLMFLF